MKIKNFINICKEFFCFSFAYKYKTICKFIFLVMSFIFLAGAISLETLVRVDNLIESQDILAATLPVLTKQNVLNFYP